MSLTELLLALGIFSIFLVGMFGLFTRGYQAFHFLNTRQSLQNQILHLKAILSDDFARTHYRSFGFLARTVTVSGREVSRDNACCLGLNDWNDPENFREPAAVPLWNRYAVYQTSLENEGRLERLAVSPTDPPPLRIRPLAGLDAFADPIVHRQLLSDNLLSFEARGDRYLEKVNIRLELLKEGGKRGLDGNKANESFKVDFQFNPRNTIPRL